MNHMFQLQARHMSHCPFHLSFHHSRCNTAWSLFASKLPDGLRHVISGILAGGSLVSAWSFCCFTHLLVWPCDFDFLSFVSAAISCQDDTMLLLH